jgi:hypothetical protein
VLQLVEREPGQYEARIAPLAEGNWLVSLDIRTNEAADPIYRTRRRLWLQP